MSNQDIAGSPVAFLWRHITRRPWQHAAIFGAVIAAVACAVSVQYGMKLLVDAMAGGREGMDAVWSALGFFITVIVLEGVFWRVSGWRGAKTFVDVGVDVRLQLFDRLVGHSHRYFADHFAGALANRVAAAASAIQTILSALTWNILPPIASFIGAVVVLTTIDWRMAVALPMAVALVAAGLAIYGIRGRKLHEAYGAQNARIGGELVDLVGNMWVVKAFSAGARERARLAGELGVEATAHRRSWLYAERMRVMHDVSLWVLAAGMLFWALAGWRDGQLSSGDVVAVSTLSFAVLNGSRDLALALVGMTEHFGRLSDALGTIAQPREIADAEDAKTHIDLGGAIAFEQVRFGYPDRETILKEFTLRVPAGQKLGVVGPSGAGKSTLVALIQRLYDVEAGQVLVDAQDIRSVTQDSLRARIAVVPQDVTLFHRSILENIRYARLDARDEEVIDAAIAARCDGFIRALPEGYQTLVGERGLKLSGGQRQRIGIARAILKNAPIVVLDEATSALDSESEREVQLALGELMRGRTVIAVAHRLSTLNRFDRIVVMQDGRIVQDGAPAELKLQPGPFQALWRLQAEEMRGEELARAA